MDDPTFPSTSSSVSSRFISQGDIDLVKARRDEQWKAAYARLGQEPPPQPTEDVFDGRSLAEKLAANKIAKQEEWEERTKLANQYRHLEEDEIVFLDSILDKQREEEMKREHDDAEEVKGFKQAVAARHGISQKSPTAGLDPPPVGPSAAPAAKAKPKPNPPLAGVKKSKSMLKGVVVKKKPVKSPTPSAIDVPKASISAEDGGPAKRRKTSDST